MEHAFCLAAAAPGEGGSALLQVMVGGLRLFICNLNNCDKSLQHSRKAKPLIVFSLQESKLQI